MITNMVYWFIDLLIRIDRKEKRLQYAPNYFWLTNDCKTANFAFMFQLVFIDGYLVNNNHFCQPMIKQTLGIEESCFATISM